MKKNLTLALLFFISIATYGQKQTLQLNLASGSTYYMTTNAKMMITEDINGQQQTINSTIASKISFKVTTVTDTGYTMNVQFGRVAMQMNVAGKSVNFDSESKTKDIFSTIMGNMTNKSFTIVMSKKGRVSSIKDIDKVYEGMFEGLSNITPEQKAQFKAQMMQSFGPKALKGSIETATAIFPNNKVGKADKWTLSTKIESVMAADLTSAFTLQDITDSNYLLHGDAVIKTDDNAPFVELSGMPVKYHMAGTAVYDMKLDKVTGWTTEARITQTIKGNVEIKDNPKVPGGMSIPMTVNTDQSISD